MFSEKNVSFTYSITELFSKIVYYLNRLIIEIDVIVVKKHVFVNLFEKYVVKKGTLFL